MQLKDLLIFKSVAEHGSFTRAAAATHTVQSNITARIKFLENEFNARLFERTSRKIELTEAGTQLLKTAKEVLHLLENAKQTINGQGQPLRGLVKIGCIHTTAALRVPGLLQSFNESYADIEFKLKTGTSAGLISEVLACKLDGAFVAGSTDDERLMVQPVLTESLGIVTSAFIHSLRELQASAKPIKLIVFSDGCSYRRQFEKIVAGWRISKFHIIELDTLEGIINAVEAGNGVTLLPVALIERHYTYKSLHVFPLPKPLSEMPTVFVRRKDVAITEAYSKFLEMLTSGYKG